MTTPEAIKKMFPKVSQQRLSEIWEKVYLPGISAIIGKIQIHPGILDDLLVEEYGQYEGSLEDFIRNKFGEDVLKAVKPN